MVEKERKFKLKSELDLFKALQKYGKPSNEILSGKIGISATTIQSIYNRIKKRKFYSIKAIPKLEMFSEVPMAVIGFSGVHPIKLKQLKEKCSAMEQIRVMILNEKEVLFFLVDETRDKLTRLIFEIMELLQARPTLHIIAPAIAKLDTTIPDRILDRVYSNLPDKRRK